jgi:transposase
MGKLSYEDKVKIYYKKKKGRSRKDIASEYKIQESNVQYLVRLIDKHGFAVLRTVKNKYYSPSEKERIINRVLINNESSLSVAIDEKLSSLGMLINWIKQYKENCYNIVERKRGRPTMIKKPKQINKKETIEEENERLKKENLYLKAELEYSKNLKAVVQARKNQQQKKK